MGIRESWRNKYYIPGTDPNPVRDGLKRVFHRGVPGFPKDIQIQTQTGCQAACVFCPYPDSVNLVPKGKMAPELFERLIAEVRQHGVTRRISPYLMNEPFLDKNVIEKSRYMKQQLPFAKVNCTTNAGMLKREYVDEIMRDNPFRHIYISMQGVEKGPYEETMRGKMDFEKTLANVEYLVEQRKKHKSALKITVTMVKTNIIDAEKAVAYWRERGVDSKWTPLENRGGNIEAFDNINACSKRIFKDCSRLMKHAYILWNGDMVLCCTDYYKTMVLGNCAETSIAEVWNSPRAVEIRRNFIRGDLRDNPLCANCFIADTKKVTPAP